MAGGVRVSLSSGDHFYVDAEFIKVAHRLFGNGRVFPCLIPVGNRHVNPVQVAQLEYHREIPSVEVVETLED